MDCHANGCIIVHLRHTSNILPTAMAAVWVRLTSSTTDCKQTGGYCGQTKLLLINGGINNGKWCASWVIFVDWELQSVTSLHAGNLRSMGTSQPRHFFVCCACRRPSCTRSRPRRVDDATGSSPIVVWFRSDGSGHETGHSSVDNLWGERKVTVTLIEGLEKISAWMHSAEYWNHGLFRQLGTLSWDNNFLVAWPVYEVFVVSSDFLISSLVQWARWIWERNGHVAKMRWCPVDSSHMWYPETAVCF